MASGTEVVKSQQFTHIDVLYELQGSSFGKEFLLVNVSSTKTCSLRRHLEHN